MSKLSQTKQEKDDHEQKFSDEEPDYQASPSQEQIYYKQLTQCQSDIDEFTAKDQNLARKDTIEVCIDILNRIKDVGTQINQQNEQTREKYYYLTYNATIMIFRLCQRMRCAGFAKEATQYLAFNVLCLDNNLILTTVKYMDWRVLNYVELARCYGDLKAFKAALKVTSYGITKVLYCKKIEEQDPPVPEGTKETIVEALRVMRTQEIKYTLQSGGLNAETWKKRVQEVFSMNKYHRSLCIVECLSLNDVGNAHLLDRNALHYDLKVACLKTSMDMLLPDIQLVKNALIQIHQKKQRDKEKKEKLQQRTDTEDLDAMLAKFKDQDMEMIKEKDWKFASYNVPVEVHIELIKLCMEAKLWTEFEELLDPALVRLKFRRYEVPFLATVDVQMSSTKISNIPNGFERLPQDLNAANLRIELKKLRASAKMSGNTEDEDVPADKKKPADPKAAAAKPDPKAAAKPDPKAKPGAKDAKAAPTQLEAPPAEQDEIQATQKELDIINHVYVYMMLQRSKSTQNAIVGIDVVMADETIGPDIPNSHFAVAVPIRQHPGSYQKSKKIPYIVFRRTANSLIDEEDCLSIVTDVQIIMGQDRNLRAPLGYHKIDVDLRQTPAELERVPNLDYVFVCYKTDKSLTLAERDLLIFRRLAELERSYVARETEEFKALPEEMRYLLTNYSLDNLNQLARTVKEALLGPLGDYYLEQRRDILEDLAQKLYMQYILPTLMRIDVYVEMRNQKEYYGDFVELLDKHTIAVKQQFVEAMDMCHRILTRDNFIENIINYSKFSVYYANLLEEKGDLRTAVQTLRSSIQKVVEYREERMKATLDSEASVATSQCITVDNRKIGDLETQIAKITGTWKELICRKERDLERKKLEAPALDDDEGDEEQEEIRLLEEEMKEKDMFEKDIDSAKWHEWDNDKKKLAGKKYFTEQDMIVHALHTDLLMCLYRCEVKLGKESSAKKGTVNQTLKESGVDLQKHAPGNLTKNLSNPLQTKLTLSKTSKTLAGNKSALKDLQQTLQEAGKLPPSMPQQLSYEKILEQENNQNPYQQALLYMSLAASKSNSVAQKSLLLESLEYIKKAKATEESMTQLAVDNAVHISAARKFHSYFENSPDHVHPFNLLGKPIYVKKTPVPTCPVMIARTSTSITLKLPFYKPITEYKNWRNITKVAVYGKLQASGVNVSLNNTDYDGTGIKMAPGNIVHVTGLIQNERYVFAVGGYNPEGVCVNGIGETCKEILTVHPLSLHQINGYLAEIAFKLGHYQIAKSAAENVCTAFVTKNEFKYSYLDTRVNPVMAVRLNTQYLNLVSAIEAKQVAESFIILAKVSKILKTDVQKRAEHRELKVESQKIDMKIANYFLIALDIAVLLNRAVLIKRVVAELFNHMIPYFQTNMMSGLLFQICVKCHQSLREIPQELIDATTRRILACINFQIMRLSFQTNEEPLLKKIMLSELPINTRKWRKFSQFVLSYPKLSEADQALQAAQKQRIAQGEIIPEVDLVKDPVPIEEKQFKFDEFEAEGNALEEFLLTLGDYSDVVRAKTEKWYNLLMPFNKSATDGEKYVEVTQKKLKEQLEFWDGLKVNNPIIQLTQICQAVEVSPRMLEFACKCIRRAMEMPDFKVDEIMDLLVNKIKVGQSIEDEVQEMINKRVELLDQDIVLKQRKRFEQLEEEVKILLEQKALNGGNKAITNKQLKQIMEMTQQGVQGKAAQNEAGNAQVIAFTDDEDEQNRSYDWLWVSEKYFLQGMCQFLQLAQFQPQRNVLNLPQTLNCVFDDIIRLDFVKFKSVMTEYTDALKAKKLALHEQYKNELVKKTYEVEERVQRITQLLTVMAQAAKFAINSRSWLQLVSIIQYVWNAFSYDLTTPLELTETTAWKPLTELAECSLYLLEYLQKGGKLRKVMNRDIDQVKNQKPQLDQKTRTVKFEDVNSEADQDENRIPIKDASTAEDTAPEEQKDNADDGVRQAKWFEQIAEFDITTQSSFISFTIQSLMCVGKWESLVDISNRLNLATDNAYASQLLPFIIFAQTTLYEKAAAETQDKKRALDSRIQEFENWKLTNKKKKSRQAMITGEIPLEEQQFLNDKAILEKEIFRLDVIENVLLSDRDASNKLLENIKRDANNADEALKSCRKLYFQFGVETQSLRSEEQRKGCLDVEQIQNYEIKSKRKSYKVFTSMVITSYKKCIDLLRKRQENFLLIQALHELGNLHYADGNLNEAEIQWNDCVDTIFQRLYVVKEWRGVFKDAQGQLADKFGSRNVLIGAIVLTKLAKLCYEGKDLHKYMECSYMAAELFAAPAKLTLPHPQICIEYNNYNFGEFLDGMLPGETPLFNDKQVIQPSELLHTLYVNMQTMYDLENYHFVLPLASLMEFIAFKCTKSSVLATKARISKALALVELGYINEAYRIYKKVLMLKNMPKYGERISEFNERIDGSHFNLPFDDCYFNDLTPENDKNKPAIDFISKPIDADVLNKLKVFCTPYVCELLQYLRAALLVRIGENQNVENLDKADQRKTILKTAEDSLRNSLAQQQIAFTIQKLNAEIGDLKIRDTNTDQEELAKLEEKLDKFFTDKEISKADQTTYYQNNEEAMCLADASSQLMTLMMRCRGMLGRLFRRQGLLINAYYSLKQALVNFKLIAEGWSNEVETGAEPKDKGSFELPEMFGGNSANAAPAKGGKAAAPAKAPAKPAAGAKGQPDPALDDAAQKAASEAEQKKVAEQQAIERVKVEQQNRRKHPHILVWLKLKAQIVQILFSQRRFEDCSDTIAVTKLECMAIKDNFYVRQLDVVDFMMQVYDGQTQSALNKGREIRMHAKKYFHNDVNYAEFLGNLSELMYNIDKRDESVEVIKEGRMIAWYKLRDQGIEIDPQNINNATDVLVDVNRKMLSDDALAAFQQPVIAAAAPAGKDAKKQAPPAKPAGKDAKGAPPTTKEEAPEDDMMEPLPKIDFTKPLKYDLQQAPQASNTSALAPNMYLMSLSMAIRFDLRYSQYLTVIQEKNELAKKILTDTQKLIDRCLYCAPQLKFYCCYLLGLSSQKIFQENVIRFQSRYANLKKYQQSLTAHIPKDFFALGQFLIELPGFSSELRDVLIPVLKHSLEQYDKAINIGKQECCLFEFDFSLRNALQGAAEVNFFLGEYRQRVLDYKYAKYVEADEARRAQNHKENKASDETLGDEVPKGDGRWEENKDSKEALAVYNHKKASVHYLEAANQISQRQRTFMDQAHVLSVTNLLDPAKIPREIASELFESSMVQKVVHSKLAGFEFKDKTTITSAEVLSYLKAILLENRFFSFGIEKERFSALISKVHRYLKTSLSSYQAQVVPDVKSYEDVTDVKQADLTKLLPAQNVRSSWADMQGRNSVMFYILGAMDPTLVKDENKDVPLADLTEEQKEQRTAMQVENEYIHFGFVEADPVKLSQLHQDVCDLAQAMTASEKLSQACNERDRKNYQILFEKYIDNFGNFFKPPVNEEDKSKDVSCIDTVRDYIPQLSIQNVKKLAEILRKETGNVMTDPNFNAILRQFHRIRYAK